MSDAVVFVLIFIGFFIARGVAATVFFYYLLPQSDRCPNCDAPTLRIESPRWNVLLPHLRVSWCYECGWHGMLRCQPCLPAPREKVGIER
ncbi:MAG: hypothetical protein H0W68_02035 [Gemmatimonadaceae bacterium]|nr:hypothetical protein [Gemmatimonadaceae bacterium]